jgi:hypothetical protein
MVTFAQGNWGILLPIFQHLLEAAKRDYAGSNYIPKSTRLSLSIKAPHTKQA